MPRDLGLSELPGLLGDQGLVLRIPGPPPLHTERLMATLGVRIEVTTVSAQDFTATRDCVAPGCPEAAEAGMTHCRRHADVSELRARENGDGGLEALERMDRGEPQAPRTRLTESGETRARVLVWIREQHRKNGYVPSQRDLDRDPDRPCGSKNAIKIFGNWGSAVVAAGYERPTPGRGGRHRSDLEATAPAEPPPGVIVRSDPVRRREMVVEWIQEFHRLNGRVPVSREIDEADDRPCSLGYVKALFGSFGEAVVAAGFDRPKRGGPRAETRKADPSRPREPDPEFLAEVEALSAVLNDAEAADGDSPDPAVASPETAPEGAEDTDVDCNAFPPEDTRTLSELVLAFEEAEADAVAADKAAEEAIAEAEKAAAAVLNHSTMRDIQAYAE